MFRILFLLFVVLPFVDLLILFRLGDRFGFVETILGVIVVGLVGASLAKREGLRVVAEWQRAMSRGRVPEEGLLSSVLVLAGATMLIAPGLLTDVIGLALLFPPTRKLVARFVSKRIERGIAAGNIVVTTFDGTRAGATGPRDRRPDVVDVEGEDVTDTNRKRLP